MPQRGRSTLAGLAVVVLFALPLLPEIAGTRRLVFRDAHLTHWPWRRVAVGALASGRVPFVNDSASGGQPLLANPNAVLLYPTMLLEKVFAPTVAFNLHYLVHVLWAFFGARALARRLNLTAGGAFFCGVAFSFSGMMMSYISAFANSGAAASWLPWCAAAGVDLVRAESRREAVRASVAAGIAFGLQLLAGEPALSLLTVLFTAFLGAAEIFGSRERRSARAATFVAGGVAAGLVAMCLAAPLLLPLRVVLPLTYRGQHLYSERAFSASPFAGWRMIEWVFPRFDGDPGAIGPGGHWQFGLHSGDVIYIWCVTFGVIPGLAILLAGLYRGFWSRRALWLGAGFLIFLLFAFGFSFPPYRLLFSIDSLRRLRYPIKFYLLTTACLSLLSGFAVERLRPGERRGGLREKLGVLAAAAFFASAVAVFWNGRLLEAAIAPHLSGQPWTVAELLPEIRRSLVGDALFGLLATTVLALVLFSRRRMTGQTHLLGLATLLLAFPWALPLFVSAEERNLSRTPALAAALRGPGRIYVSPRLAQLHLRPDGRVDPGLPSRAVQLARVHVEELVPNTAAPFGVRYLFDRDPDGSYGYYNRIAADATEASGPEEKSRLLRAFGARWVLDDEGEPPPLFRSVTGLAVAGRRLVLYEAPDPVPELRWARRDYRRASLSGAIEVIRSEWFRPETDVVLPGDSDRAPTSGGTDARLSVETLGPDGSSVIVEADAPGHVVFARTYFPAWKGRLDGNDVPVLVANARDMAIAVPPGRHRVDFRYDRAPFHLGVLLQAAALAAVGLGLLLLRLRPASGDGLQPGDLARHRLFGPGR